jgi:hypothetical protein
VLLVTAMSVKLLLRVHLTPLNAPCASINMRLPGRCADVLDAARRGVIEDLFDFFKGLLAGLREEEEHVEEHCNTKDAEDNVDLPSYVGECGRHKVG